MVNIEQLLQLKSKTEKLAEELEQANLGKAAEHVSFAVSELETRIQVAKFNRR
jgi:hypothetical protein